jgi:hypothetical protein
MGKQLNAAIQGWDVSQYPGIGGSSTTTPIPLEAQVAALINGGSLTSGDLLAKVSDITSRFAALTKGAPPNALRKLITDPDLREAQIVNPALLNGFTGSLSLTMTASVIVISGVLVAPVGAAVNAIVCALPSPVAIGIALLNDGVAGVRDDQYYVNGSSLFHTRSNAGQVFFAFPAMRV